jgi:hypothetical protein
MRTWLYIETQLSESSQATVVGFADAIVKPGNFQKAGTVVVDSELIYKN